MGLVVAVLVQGQRLMPLVRNVVYYFGVGPPRLMDVLPGGTQVYADAPALMWAVVTLFSCVASCVLLHQIIGAVITVYRNWRQRADAAPIQLFALFYCAAYLVVIVVVSFFDRFLIALMPILLLLLISDRRSVGSIKSLANRRRSCPCGRALRVLGWRAHTITTPGTGRAGRRF